MNQRWDEVTGRAAVNWTPKLDFTDQTLVYGSYSRGYKAGGANPPGAAFLDGAEPIHPLTFKPEFINAFELGSKNTAFDGTLTLNGDVFYYDYKDYQISEIVDRTSINLNFNAKVKGAELESSYEPVPGLLLNFAGGWEDTRIDNGQSAIDLAGSDSGHARLDGRQAFRDGNFKLHSTDLCRCSAVGGERHERGRRESCKQLGMGAIKRTSTIWIRLRSNPTSPIPL